MAGCAPAKKKKIWHQKITVGRSAAKNYGYKKLYLTDADYQCMCANQAMVVAVRTPYAKITNQIPTGKTVRKTSR